MSAENFIKELSHYLDKEFTTYDCKKITSLFNHHSSPVVVFKERIVEVPKKPMKKVEERIDDIILKACNIWGVELSDIKGVCRKTNLVQARYFIFCLLRERGMTVKAIGQKLNKDHSTVVYGVQQASNFIQTNFQPFAGIWEEYKK
jgi:chromosomal replication initiation ATPase DnaA